MWVHVHVIYLNNQTWKTWQNKEIICIYGIEFSLFVCQDSHTEAFEIVYADSSEPLY